MTPSDAAAALARAAAFDRRTVGEVEARAWAEAFPHFTVDEVVAAIVEHYRATTDFLMPAHVAAIVGRTRAARAQEWRTANPHMVPDADPDDVPAYLAALRSGRLVDANRDVVPQPERVKAIVAQALNARRAL
jgi:hypothetical protein